MFSKIISVSALFITVGCSSMPKDAPQELISARDELSRADQVGSEKYFPTSIAESKREFETSLSEYPKDDMSMDETAKAKSIAAAKQSYALSLGANQLTTNMKEWDKNLSTLEGNYSIPQLLSDLRMSREEIEKNKAALQKSQAEVAALQGRPMATPSTESPFARMSDFRLQSPVAYFDTDSHNLKESFHAGLDEIANSVKSHSELAISVAGYSDGRGRPEYNEKLALMRAEAVAQYLESAGIDKSRISVNTMGDRYSEDSESPEWQQLERKVVVTVGVKK